MHFFKYGITLRRLRETEIEFVRQKRNSDLIRSRMHCQEYITKEAQVRWFNGVNNSNNYFFLIFYLGEPVGLTQVKDVDFTCKDGEAGIYLWSEAATKNGVAVKASISMIDALFSILDLERVRAKVRADNPWAIRHNISIGYRRIADEFFILERDRFLSLAPKFRWACSEGKDLVPTSIREAFFQPEDARSPLYTSLPPLIRRSFMERIKACSAG